MVNIILIYSVIFLTMLSGTVVNLDSFHAIK